MKKDLFQQIFIYGSCILLLIGCNAFAPSPTPTLVPEPAITQPAAPVNAEIITESIVLTPGNINLIEPLADLWASSEQVYGFVYYGESTIVLDEGRTVTFWDVRTNSKIKNFSPNTYYESIVVSANGKRLAFVGSDSFVLVDSQDNIKEHLDSTRVSTLTPDTESLGMKSLRGAVFSPDSNLLGIVYLDGEVLIWDIESNKQLTVLVVPPIDPIMDEPDCHNIVNGMAFSADGKSFLIGCNWDIVVWDINSRGYSVLQPGNVFDFQQGNLSSFALSPGGEFLATGRDNGKVQVWQYPSGELQLELTGQSSSVSDLAFSQDGNYLVSGSFVDETVILWDIKNGSNLISLETNSGYIALSPDNKFIVTESRSGNGTLWGVPSSSLQAQRAGIKVDVSKSRFIDLGPWAATVPNQWLAPEETYPRHLVRIIPNSNLINTCTYGTIGNSAYIELRLITVTVEVVDLEVNEVIGTKTFTGSNTETCPGSTTISDTIYGEEPAMDGLESWLREILSPTGYE